jgi:hypothetical protein
MTGRKIQHLGDIRNLCDHNKNREPKNEEVDDIVSGVETIIKTVYGQYYAQYGKALAYVLGLQGMDITKLVDMALSPAQMADTVKDYRFTFAGDSEQIIMTNSIIPPVVPNLLSEQRIKNDGEIWIIHNNDADPFSSNPHPHHLRMGYKLDLANGNLYDKMTFLEKSIARKDPLAIRKKVKKIDLPELGI